MNQRRWSKWSVLSGAVAVAATLGSCGGSPTVARTDTQGEHGPTSTSSAAPPSSSTTAATVTISGPRPLNECATGELNLTAGQPNGAAGHLYVQLAFKNSSVLSCFLYGYPGASMVSADDTEIGVPATRVPPGPSRVTIAPGQSAYAVFDFVDPGALNCPIGTASQLRIYPPDQLDPLYVALPDEQLCVDSTPSLQIGAVEARAR